MSAPYRSGYHKLARKSWTKCQPFVQTLCQPKCWLFGWTSQVFLPDLSDDSLGRRFEHLTNKREMIVNTSELVPYNYALFIPIITISMYMISYLVSRLFINHIYDLLKLTDIAEYHVHKEKFIRKLASILTLLVGLGIILTIEIFPRTLRG
jgi:hypothetical protein